MAYTSFFRDPDALEAIVSTALPAMAQQQEIRVWDAGCASGEEPFTLAILFAEHLGPFGFRNLDILATDHEESSFPQFENRIRKAKYSKQDVFWVPEKFRDAHFLATDDPETFRLTPEIREKVRYLKHDLLTFQAPENHKSLIVCKNVIMHFSPEDRLKVLQMFFDTLVPKGFLVLDGFQAMPPEFASRFVRAEPGKPLFRKTEL